MLCAGLCCALSLGRSVCACVVCTLYTQPVFLYIVCRPEFHVNGFECFFLALFAFVAVCAAVAAAATCVYDDDVVVVLFFICYFSLFDSHFWFPFGSGL